MNTQDDNKIMNDKAEEARLNELYLDEQDRLADEANLKAEREARGVTGFIGPAHDPDDEWVFSPGFWDTP